MLKLYIGHVTQVFWSILATQFDYGIRLAVREHF